MQRNIIRIAIATALALLIPLALTLTGSGVDGEGFHWTPGDFLFAFVLIFGTGSLFELARNKAAGNTAYTLACAATLAGAFLLIWINGAVGIIGDSDINALYFAVIATLGIGTVLARTQPRGMSITLSVAALVQFCIPIIALLLGTEDFRPGIWYVFELNGFFVILFAVSAALFRRATA